MEFLKWIEGSALGQWVASDTYAEPVLLCFHAIGMGMVVGIVWMFNLRILGAPPRYSLVAFQKLKWVGWCGFFMNLVSGLLLFAGYATRLIVNGNFQAKMLLVLLGGSSVWGLGRLIELEPDASERGAPFSKSAKAAAVASALVWLLAIFAGRYIAYTLAPPSFD